MALNYRSRILDSKNNEVESMGGSSGFMANLLNNDSSKYGSEYGSNNNASFKQQKNNMSSSSLPQ